MIGAFEREQADEEAARYRRLQLEQIPAGFRHLSPLWAPPAPELIGHPDPSQHVSRARGGLSS